MTESINIEQWQNSPIYAICAVDEVQAAKMLGISDQTLARWRKAGLMPYVRYADTMIRYQVADIIDFINKHKTHDYVQNN